MQKQQSEQLSLFDIVLEKQDVSSAPTEPKQKVVTGSAWHRDDRETCPYRIPKLEDIVKVINKAATRVSGEKFLSDVLECGAISISNQFDLLKNKEREEQFNNIMESYRTEERNLLTEAFGLIFALLSSVVYKDGVFNDYLGELFMQCNFGNKRTGQFFTPYHVSEFMARVSVTDAEIKRGGIVSVLDPCCGGGGLLVAAADVLANQYGVNYTQDSFMMGCDIDKRCVHMTYLQLALAGVPAIVKHQNTLYNEVWDVWRTPAYILQLSRFQRFKIL